MLRVNYQIVFGEVFGKDMDGQKWKVQYHPANCELGAFIYHYKNEEGEKIAQLWTFLNDKQHVKNIMKDLKTLLGNEVYKVRLNVYYKQARRRAAEIARLKREEEERKEKEHMEQVKQEQIDECLSRGIEGKRDLWRKHLQGLYDIYDKDDEFYMGGNVLLRLNLSKDKVETSKNIRIPVEICKKMWKIVSMWHKNPACFKEMKIDTKGSGRYTISSYQNDILTAGCHKIAYTEMERMYNEIQGL